VAGNVLSKYFVTTAVLDTLLIWTEKLQISLVWRYIIQPRQKIEEVCDVHVYTARRHTAQELFEYP
jgi:hypothetical protein